MKTVKLDQGGGSLLNLVQPATTSPRPPSTPAEKQKTCAEPDCSTVLSRYNDGDRCSVHQTDVIDPASLEGPTPHPGRNDRR